VEDVSKYPSFEAYEAAVAAEHDAEVAARVDRDHEEALAFKSRADNVDFCGALCSARTAWDDIYKVVRAKYPAMPDEGIYNITKGVFETSVMKGGR